MVSDQADPEHAHEQRHMSEKPAAYVAAWGGGAPQRSTRRWG